MSARFEALQETLLKGGIAPRHVKRYLRELNEHLADLTTAQVAAGHDAPTAAARAALGPDTELADAMLKQRDFRSVSARFPWAVFCVMPPLALLFGFVLMSLMVVLLGLAGGVLPPPRPGPIVTPAWYQATGGGLMLAANFIVGALLAFGIALMAHRQRISIIWPVMAIALIFVLGPRATLTTTPYSIGIGLTSILPIFPKALGPAVLHWPTFTLQALLLSLPLFWLVQTRRKAAA